MLLRKADATSKGTRSGSVAVAIDKDKTSQHALAWTVENLCGRGQTIVLVHVLPISQTSLDIEERTLHKQQMEKQAKDLFVSFHCYCSPKEINCLDVLLEDEDKVKAIVDYVQVSAIENLVLGAPSKNPFMRRFKIDIPTRVAKAAPDFCNVYVISNRRISSVRNALRPPIKKGDTKGIERLPLYDPVLTPIEPIPEYKNLLEEMEKQMEENLVEKEARMDEKLAEKDAVIQQLSVNFENLRKFVEERLSPSQPSPAPRAGPEIARPQTNLNFGTSYNINFSF